MKAELFHAKCDEFNSTQHTLPQHSLWLDSYLELHLQKSNWKQVTHVMGMSSAPLSASSFPADLFWDYFLLILLFLGWVKFIGKPPKSQAKGISIWYLGARDGCLVPPFDLSLPGRWSPLSSATGNTAGANFMFRDSSWMAFCHSLSVI